MRKQAKSAASLILVLILLLALLPGSVFAADAAAGGIRGAEDQPSIARTAFSEAQDAARSIETAGFPESLGSTKGTAETFSGLSDLERRIVDLLQVPILETSHGNRPSTVYEIPVEELGLASLRWTAEDLGVQSIVADDAITTAAIDALQRELAFDIQHILYALQMNNPFDLYWFDAYTGIQPSDYTVSAEYDVEREEYVLSVTGSLFFSFAVSVDYAAGDYLLDPDLCAIAEGARFYAEMIALEYSELPDDNRLVAYLKEICAMASYNFDAMASDREYGNPWQAIWVFDRDPSTNVVCEGYAKAFKYLCDLSTFKSDVSCITVCGTMEGGTGEGAHMWNIVTMENGTNYLVDVTNCDEGTVGAPDQLFLTGAASGSVDGGYLFKCKGGTIRYTYDETIREIYSDSDLSICTGYYYETYTENDVTYVLTPGKAIVTEYTGTARTLTIPDTVCGRPVRAIGDHAFSKNETLETITLPASVERIEDGVRLGFSVIDDPLTGEGHFEDEGTYTPFYQCTALKRVVIPEDSRLSYIGEWAFWNCSALSSITLPSTIRTLALSAFQDCRALTELNFPEGLERINQNALSGTGLKLLSLPSSLVYIDFFNSLFELEEIIIAQGNENYRSCDGALYYQRDDETGNLTWDLYMYPFAKRDAIYRIPDFVEDFYAGYDALKGQYIGSGILRSLPYLKYIDIGKRQLTDPGFLVQDIIMDEDNPYYTLVDGILYDKEMTTVLRIPRSKTGKVILPEGLTTIGDRAGMLAQFSEIVIPDSVVNIEDCALCYNTALTHVEFPKTVETFGRAILGEDVALTEVTLPENILTLPDDFFFDCISLEKVTLPQNVRVLESTSLCFCKKLRVVYMPKSVMQIEEMVFYCSESLEDIYYEGSPEDWARIEIGAENEVLDQATIHYNYTPVKLERVKASKSSAEAGEKLSWTAAASGGSGSLQFKFDVYKDGSILKKGSYQSGKTFSFTPTEAGTYKVKVTVKDEAGTTASLTGSSVTVTAAASVVPGDIASFNVTPSAGGKITLSWSASANAKTYIIQRHERGSDVWTTLSSNIKGTSYVDTSGTAGKIYQYRIRGRNDAVFGSWKTSAEVACMSGNEPGSVGTPTVKPASGGKITVSWGAAEGAATYILQRNERGSSTWVTLGSNIKETKYTDTSAKLGKVYRYRVRSRNVSVFGPFKVSVEVAAMKGSAPGAVSDVTVTAAKKKITVSWKAAEGAASYIVQRRERGSDTWTTLNSNVKETSYVDTTGEVGAVYQYRVRSRNVSTYGPFKASTEVGFMSGSTPGDISKVTVKAASGKITVTWTASSGAAGYIVQRKVKGGSWENLSTNVTGLSYVDKTVKAGTVYQYRIRPRNGSIYGSFKASAEVTAK